MDADKVHRLFHAETRQVKFTTELIDADYPRFLNFHAGRSAGSVRGQVAQQKTLFDNDIEESVGKG